MLGGGSMRDFLNKCGGYAVIDGGFATELERLGVDLNDPLWSAKCLFTSPHLVRRVHLIFFLLLLFEHTSIALTMI
jgi:S-methylmethionine-dependent homocysteine/selenocysteine methylase